MGPITANHSKDMAQAIGPGIVSIDKTTRSEEDEYFVIVPSISEMSTLSVCSQTKMRAVHAMTPEADSENVIVFAPGFKSSVF